MVAQFAVDMKRIAEKTQRKLETVAQEITNDLAESVIDRTPFDTGFARGSWYASLNGMQAGPEGSQDPSGAVSFGRVSLTVNDMEIGDVIYILNNANYIEFLENGSSTLAPNGMVAVTVNDAPQIAERTAQRIAKK